jgi:GH24 family phage-related lysozyme (muramidase)
MMIGETQDQTNKMLLYSEGFLNYVKSAENDQLFKTGTGIIQESPEGGNDTVGYGHKLTDEEIASGKVYGYNINNLNKNQANTILIRDLEEKNKILNNKLGTAYTDLDPKRKQMLLDIQFNVRDGIDSFPKFTEAVLNNDTDTMKKQYKRYFKNKQDKYVELARNKQFSSFFFGDK